MKISTHPFVLVLVLAATAFAQGPYPVSITGRMSFPLVSSPVIYALQSGAPIRSGDNGATWTPLYVFAAGTAQGITDVVVQPDNPAIVYPITTMERGGVWKSTDSGATWSRANAGLPAGAAAVQSFTVTENQPQTLYARIGNQIFRSTNGGSAWTLRGSLPGGATAVGISKQAPARMYTMTRGGVVQRSTDEGASWARAGAFENDLGRFAIEIVVDPQDSETIYIETQVETTTGRCAAPSAGLMVSNNGGATLLFSYTTGVCNVSPAVFLDRRRPLVHLRLGFFGGQYCRSSDRGGKFDCFDRPGPAGIDPRNGDILFGGAGRSVSRDAGETFQPFPTTLRPTLPVPATPIILEIEEGGTNRVQQLFSAVESSTYRMPFTATVTQGAWLTLTSATGTTGVNLALNVSTQGLAAGTYDGTLRLVAPHANNSPVNIPLQLRVIPRAASGLRFVSSVAAENLSSPRHLQLDSNGNIWFYGFTAGRIQRVDAQGRVTNVLGSGVRESSPDGTATAQVQLPFINGFALDAQNNPYWSETASVRTIRNGTVATLLSPNDTFGGGQFPIRFGTPRGIALDAQGNLYVPSTPGILRRSPSGQIAILQSSTVSGGTLFPQDIAVAADGTIYFSDSLGHRVYRLRQGQLITLAGTGTAGFNGDSRPANTAQLNRPSAVDVDRDGVVYIADTSNNRVRAVTPDGQIFTVIGRTGNFAINPDGTEGTAAWVTPEDVLVEPDGSLLVVQTSRIYRFRRVRGLRPEISPLSMRHAASGGEVLAPGSLFSLFGSNFATGETIVSEAPWPTEVQGLSVLINGRAAPLYYVGPNQINGQVPYETSIGLGTVQVRSTGGSSATIDFDVARNAPGILQFGANRAVAVNPDGSINTEETTAPPESILLIYLTGFGGVNNPVPTGAAAPGDPLSRPTAPVRVLVGDAEAEVLFIGLAPGFVGLGQANIKLPPLPPGTYAVTLAVGEAVSNFPLITIGAMQ